MGIGGWGTACGKEKNELSSSPLHETKPQISLPPGSHLGDEVRVLQTGKLQDWLLDPLYVQGCLGSWLLLNKVQ